MINHTLLKNARQTVYTTTMKIEHLGNPNESKPMKLIPHDMYRPILQTGLFQQINAFLLKYQYNLDNANYTNDLRPLVLTYMTLLSSNTGAFIWRGTIHPRGARPPEAPPWRRGSISSMSTSRSVQLLETELSLSPVLDYGTVCRQTLSRATLFCGSGENLKRFS